MSLLSKRIGNIGLVPVVVLGKVEYAIPTAKALLDGGLPLMEITLRTDAAIESIKTIKKTYPEIILGAGTVLSVQQAKEAIDAGCEFIVSPGFNDDVVEYCIDNNIVCTPGCVTPTEIEHALKFGIKTIKFFPANIYGGVNGCKALHGPYRMVKFIPTGGVNLKDLSEYADKEYIHAIGGGWLCSAKDIAKGNYKKITETVKKSIDSILGFNLGSLDSTITVCTNNIDRAKYYIEAAGHEVSNFKIIKKEIG